MPEQREAAGDPGNQVKERVARRLYLPFMALLLLWFTASIAVSATLVVSFSRGVIEPDWVISTMPVFELAGQVLNPMDSEASRALDAISVTVLALVMGVFLGRCSSHSGRFEIALIIVFLVAGVLQLVLVMVLPSPAEADGAIHGGEEAIANLGLILTRNSNIALALFAAAIGVQYQG